MYQADHEWVSTALWLTSKLKDLWSEKAGDEVIILFFMDQNPVRLFANGSLNPTTYCATVAWRIR